MKIWTVSNQKGGVGKTSTTVTLGGLLASRGFNTLLIDLDPQGSLTSYFRLNSDQLGLSVYNLFQDAADKKPLNPMPYVTETKTEGLSVLPASTAIATLDRQAGQLDGMGLVLVGGLEAVTENFDYVLIDCPPMLGVLMVNALAACQQLIVPVIPEFLSLKGLERMMRTVTMINRSRKKPLRCTIVPTLFDRRTREAIQSLAILQEKYPKQLASVTVPVDAKIRDASRAGSPASHYSPKAKAVIAYDELLENLLLHR